MSNGAASAETATENNEKKSCEAGGDAFGRAVARIAVAQICESAGFQSSQQSALDALADIAVRYLRDLGKSAHYYANLAGRTDCNALDVIQSMEDMNQPQGFTGASDILSRRLSASATVKDIIYYINRKDLVAVEWMIILVTLLQHDAWKFILSHAYLTQESKIKAWGKVQKKKGTLDIVDLKSVLFISC